MLLAHTHTVAMLLSIIFDTMEHVFKMDMTPLGSFNLVRAFSGRYRGYESLPGLWQVSQRQAGFVTLY